MFFQYYTNSVVATGLFLYVCCGIICWYLKFGTTLKTELQLERFEGIGGKGVAKFDLRVRKFNHSTYSINGTFDILQDLDESFEISASFAYSTLGNNQFNEYPMKVPRKTVCDFMVDQYLRCQYLWCHSSNMPRLEWGTTKYCPFPKGAYWIKDVVPDASWVPPVVPTGLWRVKISVWGRSSDPVFKMLLYVKFSKKII